MNLRYLNLLFFLILYTACQQNLEPEISEEIISPETNYDPGQPHRLLFTTPGSIFYQGQTVLGWENHLIQRGEASPSGNSSQSVPISPRGASECATQDFIKLYQNGAYLRDLSNTEVNLYYEYTPQTILQRFEWTIPMTQAVGTGYQLQLWWGNCLPGPQGDKSPFFEIRTSTSIEILHPNPWVHTYEQDSQLNFSFYSNCSASSSSVIVSLYEGSQLKDQRTWTYPYSLPSGGTSGSGTFGLPSSSYQIGTNYRVVFELDCGGTVVSKTRFFTIIESTSGGIAPPDF